MILLATTAWKTLFRRRLNDKARRADNCDPSGDVGRSAAAQGPGLVPHAANLTTSKFSLCFSPAIDRIELDETDVRRKSTVGRHHPRLDVMQSRCRYLTA